MAEKNPSEPKFYVASSDDLARLIPHFAKKSDPATCSKCGGPLQDRGEMHGSGRHDHGRRRFYLAWATCLTCHLWFAFRSPPRSAEQQGWQLEPNPPAFLEGSGE